MAEPASSSFHSVPCECCGSTRFSTVRDWNNVSQIVRCGECGLEFVNPLPSEEYLNQIILQEMKGETSGTSFYRDYILERKQRAPSYEKRVYRKRMDLIERLHPSKGRLLDIGCGAGFFLEYAKKRGWQVHGIDILPEYIRFAREELDLANTHCGTLEESPLRENRFDVVTLWDLIEHLRHPMSLLKRIHSTLDPGGLVAVWTPNVRNAAFLKGDWYGYAVHQHLYFFSGHTLAELLSRCGFNVIYQKTTRAKKGFFSPPQMKSYRPPSSPPGPSQKFLRGLRRDLKNSLNPVNYLSPLLDLAGYGFNLLIVARKT